LNERLKAALIVISWSLIISSILLRALYERPILSVLELALLVIVSIFAGAVMANARTVVLGYIASIILTIFITYFSLVLPVLLNKIGFAPLGDLVYQQAIIMVFRGIFPVPIFLCFIGAFVGGFLGERLFGQR